RIASRHHAEWCRLASAFYDCTTGVSKPGHLFKVAQQGIRPVVRDANAVGLMTSLLSTFSESLHMAQ
ncbi:hypothetical protein, partial [Stenotrophomonas maltophilia]|uniref:hypothetical protein n=1 Tax=Stenotrophomonas maltophilia TaxID=40324 RepID=UPI00195574FA